ncbi:MAG: hypothetical protein ACPG4T_14455 [Nannocystaceae bacterium]
MNLEDLEIDMRVYGLVPSGAVTLFHVKRDGPDSVTVRYELPDGEMGKQVLYREHENKLHLDAGKSSFQFDGEPEELKLAIEAQRIQLAHLFDPMMAVHSSDVEPLPHQIAAVYQEMLPRQPLRGPPRV